MFQQLRGVVGWFLAVLSLVAFAIGGSAVPSAHAAAGGRSGGGGYGGARAGGVIGRGSIARPPISAARTGFGVGFQSGFSRRFHGGGARSSFHHQFRTPSRGSHRFHGRPSFFFNLGGFANPLYYYPPIAYYPTYSAYSIPYDPGYAAVNIPPYSYVDPVAPYPQADPGNVQVYTAPPEPGPPPLPQTPPMPQHFPPPPPLDDGALHFEVSPPEAKVFLDNRYVGEARELRNIAEITASAGRHLLEIRLDAERTFTEVVVAPRKVTPVHWAFASSPAAPDTLRPESGRLRVQVAPHGAAIYLDGIFSTVADLAHPPSLPVSPGHHRVQVVMPGYKAYSADVTVPESGEAILAVQLARE